jgi:hypothetical protein
MDPELSTGMSAASFQRGSIPAVVYEEGLHEPDCLMLDSLVRSHMHTLRESRFTVELKSSPTSIFHRPRKSAIVFGSSFCSWPGRISYRIS